MPTAPTQLAFLSQARRAIEKARSVPEVKAIRDKAEMFRMCAKKAGEGLATQNFAAEIKLRAERRAGELLKEMGLKAGNPQLSNGKRIGLSDLGIDRNRSSCWKRIASVSEPVFEKFLVTTMESGDELTSVGAIRLAKVAKRKLRQAAATSTPSTVDKLEALAESGQKFGGIYCDPPWEYGNQTTRSAVHNNYGTMTFEELAALPVRDLAAPESHLHLWTTNGFLKDALMLLDGWGFEFKSTFAWVKPQLGIGNYWRCSHELMLLGVRGGLTFPPTNIKSWIEHDRMKHSAKPEAVAMLIEKVSPPPWLEMFGRRKRPGWTVWGNQVESGIFDPQEEEPEAA